MIGTTLVLAGHVDIEGNTPMMKTNSQKRRWLKDLLDEDSENECDSDQLTKETYREFSSLFGSLSEEDSGRSNLNNDQEDDSDGWTFHSIESFTCECPLATLNHEGGDDSDSDESESECSDSEEYDGESILKQSSESFAQTTNTLERHEKDNSNDISHRFRHYTTDQTITSSKPKESSPSEKKLRFCLHKNTHHKASTRFTRKEFDEYWYSQSTLDTFKEEASARAEVLFPNTDEETDDIPSYVAEVIHAVYGECCHASSEEGTKSFASLECLRKLYTTHDLFGMEHNALSQTRGDPKGLTRFVLNFYNTYSIFLEGESSSEALQLMLAQTSRTSSRSSRIFARESAVALAMSVFGYEEELFTPQQSRESSRVSLYNDY